MRWAKEVWRDRPDSLIRVERLQPAWLKPRHVQGRIQQDQEANPQDIPRDRAGLERESQRIARTICKLLSFNPYSCHLLALKAFWTSFTILTTRTTMRAKSDCIICLISISNSNEYSQRHSYFKEGHQPLASTGGSQIKERSSQAKLCRSQESSQDFHSQR